MVLRLDTVRVTRSGTSILRDINVRLCRGQIVGLVGPNGAGKSTLINAIATLIPFSGTIRWQGLPIRLREIGYMPQQAQVRADLSVIETVLLGRHEQLGWRVATTHLDQALGILEDFGIAHLARRNMQSLSGGQQQLVLLTQRLLREPKLVLLDEATSALDIRHQLQVFDRLRAYVGRSGALVVIAIHDLNLAARHADTIMLLDQGQVAGSGSFAEVIHEQALRDVYGIEAELLRASTGHTVILPVTAYGSTGPTSNGIHDVQLN